MLQTLCFSGEQDGRIRFMSIQNTFNAIITKIPPSCDILTLTVKYHGMEEFL